MADSTGQVAFERKQMLRVRAALLDGFEREDRAQLIDFFQACGAYLVWAQQRVFVQDQMIHDLLSERVPSSEVQAHQLLSTLQDGMNTARRIADVYQAAVKALDSQGPTVVDDFHAATTQYFQDAARAMPGGRNPMERWTDEHFTPADWQAIAHISDDIVAEEKRLFAAVVETAPDGIDPPSYEVFHPKAPD